MLVVFCEPGSYPECHVFESHRSHQWKTLEKSRVFLFALVKVNPEFSVDRSDLFQGRS